MSDRMEKERHNDKRQKNGSQWRSHVSVPLFLRGGGALNLGRAGGCCCMSLDTSYHWHTQFSQ